MDGLFIAFAIGAVVLAITFRDDWFADWTPTAAYTFIACYLAFLGGYYYGLKGAFVCALIAAAFIACVRLLPTGPVKVVLTFFVPLGVGAAGFHYTRNLNLSLDVEDPRGAIIGMVPIVAILIAVRFSGRARREIFSPVQREIFPPVEKRKLLPPPRGDA